jgi:F-type H+-transporting ATPase subunit b
MLGFDVPTFVFQIINFLVLLAILARFFYRPVIEVMQRRQEQIDARIEDAETRARQADEERQQLAQQSETAAREAAALLESARDTAATERQRLLEAAKAEAAGVIDEARKHASTEEEAALGRLSQRLSQSAVSIAGALIRGASGKAVHDSLVQRLATDGFGLDEEAQKQVRLDFRKDANRVIVESAYPLDDAQELSLRQQAAQTLGLPPEQLRIEVREDAELIAGVRVLLGALVVDMSLMHQLQALSNGQEDGR